MPHGAAPAMQGERGAGSAPNATTSSASGTQPLPQRLRKLAVRPLILEKNEEAKSELPLVRERALGDEGKKLHLREMQDLYGTLGVPRDATQDDIKKAFRKQAQRYHPDVVGASAGAAERAVAEAKFKEASAAYEVRSTRGWVGRERHGGRFDAFATLWPI